MTDNTKDRDYYRVRTNDELIEEARCGVRVNWEELAVVLAERLHKAKHATYRDWECPECGY